ncbi:MAG: TIGR00730 family Rossman fold protein [Nitrospirae bacterium]|nr:TIGR00730 family Rossman fold protein [Nitrospirota bacterium]
MKRNGGRSLRAPALPRHFPHRGGRSLRAPALPRHFPHRGGQIKTVAVFCGSLTSDGDPNYRDARSLGRMLAEAGFQVITGGYQGSMEAVSRGAREAGGPTAGLTTEEFKDYKPNRYLDRVFHHPEIYKRLKRFISMADAFVVLRGGVGTLTELTLIWSLRQAGIVKKPIILLGDFWNRVFAVFGEELLIRDGDYRLVNLAQSPAEAVAMVKRHLLNGRGTRRAEA